MPSWAILYCFLILLSDCTILYVYRKRSHYYVLGQIVSFICTISIFLFYYDFYFSKPESVWIILLIIGYIAYWTFWENRFIHPKLLKNKQTAKEVQSEEVGIFPKADYYLGFKEYIYFWLVFIITSLPLLFIIYKLLLTYI